MLVLVVLGVVVVWAFLAYLLIPIVLLLIAAGTVTGLLVGLSGAVRGLSGNETGGVPDEAPDDKRPRSSSAPYPLRDRAWPHYLTAQLLIDLRNTVVLPTALTLQVLRTLAAPLDDRRRTHDGLWAWAPYLAGALVFTIAMLAGTLAALLLVLVLGLAVALIGSAVGVAGAVLLRSIDLGVRRWRRAAAVCLRCSWVTALPAYRCPDCDHLHRDVRPGPLGIWSRVCGCGARMPTTVLRSARRLAPTCPRCEEPLPDEAGVATVHRIVIAGGPGTGKTSLWRAAVPALTKQPPEPAGGLSDRNLAIRVVRPATAVVSGPALLVTFDPPGEIFRTEEAARHVLSPAGYATNHLLTLDPLALPAVRAAASAADRGDPPFEQISLEYAERPYRLLVEQIREHGGNTRRCVLAVVVTKMDELWTGAGAQRLGLSGHSAPKPRTWLADVGLRNLVLAADRDFGRVRYFFHGVPPDGHFAHTPRHFAEPSAPFHWLMRHSAKGMAIR
ncbi:hypothetical protein [Jidongwangia harbinensis]|uniref:hypothetical protein n=1 Tax=Jidongwangia harbinensis TaxID=2878561 RepID=UPI001CD91BF7|nr:hypothetical protein [Jidongwangia harbinensis]MCA2211637.1 hypothetical protein [Jidongwangia harbinensis]